MSTIDINEFEELYYSKLNYYTENLHYTNNKVIATFLFEFFLKKNDEMTDANRDVIYGFLKAHNGISSDSFNKLFSFVRTNFDLLNRAWKNVINSNEFEKQLGALMFHDGL